MHKNLNDTVAKKDLGQRISHGRNADIYSWGDNQILKLYKERERWSEEIIEYERRVSEVVYAAGLPVPAVGELVHINNRTGIIYERVDGISMIQMIARKPWKILRYFRRMAELHFEIHSNTKEVALNNQKHLLENKIKQSKVLSEKLRQKMLAELNSLPGGNRLCHGDFHPKNIIMTDQGETIIDWPNGSIGNPIADLARTTYLTTIRGGKHLSRNPSSTKAVRYLHNIYLKHYFTLCPGGEQEYRRWIPVVAAANIRKKLPDMELWLDNLAESVL